MRGKHWFGHFILLFWNSMVYVNNTVSVIFKQPFYNIIKPPTKTHRIYSSMPISYTANTTSSQLVKKITKWQEEASS
jgi:hypothetical protein